MISYAYPNPNLPVLSTGGTIHGRLVSADTLQPVFGINVVAVNNSTDVPAVSRISGAAGVPGEFDLVGLPPGDYEVCFLDGHSYRGSISIKGVSNIMLHMQADNFTTFSTGVLHLSVGQVIDIGDIPIQIWPITIDGIHNGPITGNSIPLSPLETNLPSGQLNTPYEVWLHIRGGLRDMTAQVSGLPMGLTGSISRDPRSWNSGVHGNHFVTIKGTPLEMDNFIVNITVTDSRGISEDFTLFLFVEPEYRQATVAYYPFIGNTNDVSGNAHNGIVQGLQANFTDDRFGFPNSALEFNGVDNLVMIPDDSSFELNEFTLFAILKVSEYGKDSYIISKGDNFGNFTLKIWGKNQIFPGYISYIHQTQSGNWSAFALNKPVPLGEFFCLAVTVSPSEGFKSYFNGEQVTSIANPPLPVFNTDPVTIGAGWKEPNVLDYYFHGIIDEILIYRGVMSEGDIIALCNEPVGPGLCAVWSEDSDGDDSPVCNDCDDTDPTVYPGAPGTYKGKDNDCSGIIDEDEVRGGFF